MSTAHAAHTVTSKFSGGESFSRSSKHMGYQWQQPLAKHKFHSGIVYHGEETFVTHSVAAVAHGATASINLMGSPPMEALTFH